MKKLLILSLIIILGFMLFNALVLESNIPLNNGSVTFKATDENVDKNKPSNIIMNPAVENAIDNRSAKANTRVHKDGLDELQKTTTINLSDLDDEMKRALLDGSAEILPDGNIRFPPNSTYMSDILTHPLYQSGLSANEYFEQDTNISKWARVTENQISEALNKAEVRDQFSDLVIHDFSCRDTMCRVSFTGRVGVSSLLTKHFTSIPTHETGRRSISTSTSADGNTHLYISRNMIKEPEY